MVGEVRCVKEAGCCGSRYTKSGHRFDVDLEMDKRVSWKPQEAEHISTETLWDDAGPHAQIKEGPNIDTTSTPHRSNICPASTQHLPIIDPKHTLKLLNNDHTSTTIQSITVLHCHINSTQPLYQTRTQRYIIDICKHNLLMRYSSITYCIN